MRGSQVFDSMVVVVVVLLHTAFLGMLSVATPPRLDIGMPAMEVVNLGDLQTGKVQEKVEPVVLPQPKPKVEKKLLTVKQPQQKPDIIEKPKPKVHTPPPRPEPVAPSQSTAPTANTGSSTASGGADAGSGRAETVATHMGGHLRNPKPPYPPLSIDNNEEGVVRLKVMVEENGYPSSVELSKSSGYPRLDKSALKTVREKYRFTPATRLGVPIRSVYTFNIVFKLNQR